MSTARGRLQLLWGAVALQLLGRALDLRWHLNNDEFEGVSQQFEAHWLLWLGVLATLGVAIAGARRVDLASLERRGYLFVLASALAYSAVAIWHFVEHANHQDPEVAHVLLGMTQAAMVTGAIVVAVSVRRRAREPAAAGG
jgi:hypothetical protein